MKNLRFLGFIFSLILFGLCCKENKYVPTEPNVKSTPLFKGDSLLSKKDYFKKIIKKNGENILNKQNKIYLNKFHDFSKSEFKSKKNDDILLKLIKENLNTTETKVNFFTYKNGKKVDSLNFYRNVSGDGFGRYICMSYFDDKNNKLWQFKYFPSKMKDPSNIISYTERSINTDGKIKLDSIHYLDESLDVEMQQYNLYY